MKIYKNCFLFRGYEDVPYYPYDYKGVLIREALRLPHHHPNKYWSNYHHHVEDLIDMETILSYIKEENECGFNYFEIPECVYVGGITNHIGHFILESLSKLSEATMMSSIPTNYYIGDAVLPEGIVPCPKEEIKTVVDTLGLTQLEIPPKGAFYMVDTLYVPEKPYILSHSCSEPWKTTEMIKKIVSKAVKLYPMEEIDILYLKRFGEAEDNKGYTYSDPNLPLLEQISMIYHSRKLIGQVGSNTHMCVFAKYDTETEWKTREGGNSGHYEESYRNQAICDLIKTFNKFDIDE